MNQVDLSLLTSIKDRGHLSISEFNELRRLFEVDNVQVIDYVLEELNELY